MPKLFGMTTVAAIMAVFVLTAHAFSPIWNVDGWDRDRLSKAGISVHAWQHKLEGEDPPLQWVQVSVSCEEVPKDQAVVMTAWSRSSDLKTLGASRVERSSAIDGKLTLVFCVVPDQMDASSVEVHIWSNEAVSGYKLSMKRIAELAREQAVAIPATK